MRTLLRYPMPVPPSAGGSMPKSNTNNANSNDEHDVVKKTATNSKCYNRSKASVLMYFHNNNSNNDNAAAAASAGAGTSDQTEEFYAAGDESTAMMTNMTHGFGSCTNLGDLPGSSFSGSMIMAGGPAGGGRDRTYSTSSTSSMTSTAPSTGTASTPMTTHRRRLSSSFHAGIDPEVISEEHDGHDHEHEHEKQRDEQREDGVESESSGNDVTGPASDPSQGSNQKMKEESFAVPATTEPNNSSSSSSSSSSLTSVTEDETSPSLSADVGSSAEDEKSQQKSSRSIDCSRPGSFPATKTTVRPSKSESKAASSKAASPPTSPRPQQTAFFPSTPDRLALCSIGEHAPQQTSHPETQTLTTDVLHSMPAPQLANHLCRPFEEATFQTSDSTASPLDPKSSAKIIKYAKRRLEKSGVETYYLESINRHQQHQQEQHAFEDAYDAATNTYVPAFQHSDIGLGKMIGQGSFSSVYAVESIDGQDVDNTILDSSKVVVKTLRRKLLDKPSMLSACIADLCKEGLLLASLSLNDDESSRSTDPSAPTAPAHSGQKYIVKLFGWCSTLGRGYMNGRHDAHFLLLERIDQTLGQQLSSWREIYAPHLIVTPKKTNTGAASTAATSALTRSASSRSAISSSSSSRRLKGKDKKGPGRFFSRIFGRKGRNDRKSLKQSLSPSPSATSPVKTEAPVSVDETPTPVVIQHDDDELYHFWLFRLELMIDLADAMEFLHSRKIIHRDLKPDNVGLTNDGCIKVLDFDIARVIPKTSATSSGTTTMTSNESSDSLSSLVSTAPSGSTSLRRQRLETIMPCFHLTRKVGSPRYMSPEVSMGNPYNELSDVWGCSLLINETLTLARPFVNIPASQHQAVVFEQGQRPVVPSVSSSSNSGGNSSSSSQGTKDVFCGHLWTSSLKKLQVSMWSNEPYDRPTMERVKSTLRQELDKAKFSLSSSSPEL
mmetsp:Transcript_31885/g.77434  ORF Transcript_31885/g.77434 Transcript_31885/m.77434 type:complete len:948 (-) Transcript_31885:339-3182(-)